MENVRRRAKQYLARQQRLHRWHKVVTALAGVVVFCTTYALILPAVTMTTPLVCEKTEHTHSEECYTVETVTVVRELVCQEPELEGHLHDESCYTSETTYACGLEETEAHVHGESCAGLIRGELTCTLETEEVEREVERQVEREVERQVEVPVVRETLDDQGNAVTVEEMVTETVTETVIETVVETETVTVPHEHTDACYAWSEGLICGLAETEGHAHTEECGAETVETLTCLEPEVEGHAHTDVCYLIPENEGETVENRTLTCEQEEHAHHDNCYLDLELEEPVKRYCGFDTEHTHTEGCYFESGELLCTIPEHTHADVCLVEPVEPQYLTLDNDFFYEGEDVVIKVHVTGQVLLPILETVPIQPAPEVQPAEPAPEVQPAEPAPEAQPTEPAPETQPAIQSAGPALELVVTEAQEEADFSEYYELAEAEGEVMMVRVFDYALTWGGITLDLSQCQVTAEVTPTQLLEEMMNDPASIMTINTFEGEQGSEVDEADMAEAMAMRFSPYTQQKGRVAYAITQGANPHFTVQYYAYLSRAVKQNYDYGDGTAIEGEDNDQKAAKFKELVSQGKLLVINTDNGSNAANADKRGGKLPENGTGRYVSPNDNPISYLQVDKNGRIMTETTLTEIYMAKNLEYQKAPGLKYFNIVLKNQNTQYVLQKIWVLKPEKNPSSLNEDDWFIYTYNKDTTRFTNRPETAQADKNFILINENDVIRLVYGTNEVAENFPANFYDYNITDGNVYTNASDTKPAGSAGDKAQDIANGQTFFVKSKGQGINSDQNYIAKSKPRLAFGNANAGTGLHEVKWQENLLNKANARSFTICTFKLAPSAKAVQIADNKTEYRIQFDDGVAAPNLFNEGTAEGKKTYSANAGDKYSLNFERVGDTYTLKAVNGGKDENGDELPKLTGDLTRFNHPQAEGKTHTHIYTNNFWPMDSETVGTDAHFGAANSQIYYNENNKSVKLPISDDGLLHNSYFGMHFAVTFDLTKDYVGPLEYYFFGDDDMWVYLNDTLVCDIGGVHSSVGEYVNLWDYINRADLDKLAEDQVKTYTLTFYYTERGASGSTCWMQFTLPTVVGLNLETELEKEVDNDHGSLWIEKQLTGVENTDYFEFKLDLESSYDNYVVQGPNGEVIKQGNEVLEFIGEKGQFRLQAGAVLVVQKIPVGTKYTIEEVNTTGYHTQISTNGGEPIAGTIAEGAIEPSKITKVVFTNSASYELPATGGGGTTLYYTMGVLLLAAAACLMYINKHEERKRGDAMC